MVMDKSLIKFCSQPVQRQNIWFYELSHTTPNHWHNDKFLKLILLSVQTQNAAAILA